MPSITSNIPSIIVYSFTMSEFVKITGSTLLLKNFLPVAGSKQLLLKQIKKSFNRHPKTFQKYHIVASDIVSKIAAT